MSKIEKPGHPGSQDWMLVHQLYNRVDILEHVVNQLMARIQDLESSKGIVKPFDLEPK